MIIILEGPDGAGKSTAAKLLKQTLDEKTGRLHEIIHMSYPKDTDDESGMFKMYATLLETKTDFILDRAWFSELVYGPIIRDHSVLGGYTYQLLNLIAREKQVVVIYCTGDRDLFWDRCTKRGEHYVTSKEQFDGIYLTYEWMFKSPLKTCIGLPIYYFDTTNDQVNQFEVTQ